MINKKFSITYFQTLTQVFWTLWLKKTWIMTINEKNWKKTGKNCQKYAEIRDVKLLQDIPFNLHIKQ